MNWLEQYKKDFGFQTNYQLSHITGITESTLSSLKKANNWKKAQFWNMTLFAKAADLDLNDFFDYLTKYEEENEMEKLTQIFNKYGLNTDWIDVLEEEGKVNMGDLEDLTFIDDINNETAYTAYYTNDFQGGVVIEK